MPQRVLVIQLERLGDLIQTTPLLADLAAAGDVELEVLCVDEVRHVLDGAPWPVKVIGLPASTVVSLGAEVAAAARAGRRPTSIGGLLVGADAAPRDRVINVSHGPLASFLAGALPARHREGPTLTDGGEKLYLGPWHVYSLAMLDFRGANSFNLVDLYRCGAPAGRIPVAGDRPHLRPSPRLEVALPPSPRVAINPGTSDPRRRWPGEHFARLAQRLAAAGIAPILVGSEADRPICAAVAAACDRAPLDLTGRLSVAEQARLFQLVDLVVSNDTGAVHIAAAVGAPVLGVYGGSSLFRETAPWSEGHWVLQAPALGSTEGMERLSPELVALAVEVRLGRRDRAELRERLVADGVAAWETRFLPPGADPLGGLDYRPLHDPGSDREHAVAGALRTAIARAFRGVHEPQEAPASDAWSDERHDLARLGEELGRLDGALRASRDALAANDPRSAGRALSTAADGIARLPERFPRVPAHAIARFLDWTIKSLTATTTPGVIDETREALARMRAIARDTSRFL